jgi:hypothetical protein
MTRPDRCPTRNRHHRATALATAIATALVAAAAIAACSATTEPEHVLRIGVISTDGQPYVSLPDSAVAGQDFTIYILTFGDCRTTRDHTQVEYSAGTPMVTPWNRHSTGNCHEIGRTVEHTATLRFDTRGEAHVSVRGWMIGGLGIAHYHLFVH